jgi:hypothetical protein
MNIHTDGRSDAGALVPLSPLQRKRLVLLAREAWLHEVREHAAPADQDDAPFAVPGEREPVADFDAWRRRQCMIAVERPGLSLCRNEDYLPLQAHFLMILGRIDEAESAGERAAMDPRNRAMHEFRRACSAAASVLDNPESYAEGFLRRACGVGLADASDRQIWRAVYLLKRKAGLEVRKERRNAKRVGDSAADGDAVEAAAAGVGAAGAGVAGLGRGPGRQVSHERA